MAASSASLTLLQALPQQLQQPGGHQKLRSTVKAKSPPGDQCAACGSSTSVRLR
jgi:hypothetical protein